jgi:hypothetical protein
MATIRAKAEPKSKKKSSPGPSSEHNGRAKADGLMTQTTGAAPLFSAGPAFLPAAPVQAKVEVGHSDDRFEKEADDVAESVMRFAATGIAERRDEEEEIAQSKPLVQTTPVSVRNPEEEEETSVQSKSANTGAAHVAPASSIVTPTGPGSPLVPGIRSSVEPVLGANLADVRVHSNQEAHESAASIRARAYTHRNNIWLGAGESPYDLRLMAHESTHVVQQSQGGASLRHVQPKFPETFETPESTGDPQRSLGEALDTGGVPELFPFFASDALVEAETDIARQIGKDIHDPEVRESDLQRVVVPSGKEAAYRTVMDQIRLEISLRNNVREFFQGLTDFVQNLNMSFHTRMSIVSRYLELQNSDVANIFMTRMISEAFEAIGEIPNPVAKIASEALKIVWDTYQKASEASSANTVSRGVINQLDRLDAEFNGAISTIESMRQRAMSDWGVLQRVGALTWPQTTSAMREAGGVAFEIRLWRELLPLKWKVYRSSDSPSFHRTIDWVERNQERNQGSYYVTERVDEEHWHGDRHGWNVTEYWLGSGSSPFTHTTPDVALVLRILSLGVTRRELFLEWGLPTGIYVMPAAGPM